MSQQQQQKLIVVVGATGNQGGSVIQHLKKLSARNSNLNFRIRGLTRNTSSFQAQELSTNGVEMVQCDLNDKQQVIRAFDGAHTVFAVTNYWQPDIMANPQLEFDQGRNMVDAAVSNGVKHFIWSSLEDAQKTASSTNKNLQVPHFTNKHRVEEYVRAQNFEWSTFVYPGFFFENFANNHGAMFHFKNREKTEAVVRLGIDESVQLPMFSINDIGVLVAKFVENPDEFNGRQILGASELLTMPQCCEVMSRVLNIKTTYEKIGMEQVKKEMGGDMAEMLMFFNEMGFYVRDQQAKFDYTRKRFGSELKTFEEWLRQHSDLFLKTSFA